MTTVRRRLYEQTYRGYTAICKPLVSRKNRMSRLQSAKKYLKELPQFWKMILLTDETTSISDGKCIVWSGEGTAQDPKHTTSSVLWPGNFFI